MLMNVAVKKNSGHQCNKLISSHWRL